MNHKGFPARSEVKAVSPTGMFPLVHLSFLQIHPSKGESGPMKPAAIQFAKISSWLHHAFIEKRHPAGT